METNNSASKTHQIAAHLVESLPRRRREARQSGPSGLNVAPDPPSRSARPTRRRLPRDERRRWEQDAEWRATDCRRHDHGLRVRPSPAGRSAPLRARRRRGGRAADGAPSRSGIEHLLHRRRRSGQLRPLQAPDPHPKEISSSVTRTGRGLRWAQLHGRLPRRQGSPRRRRAAERAPRAAPRPPATPTRGSAAASGGYCGDPSLREFMGVVTARFVRVDGWVCGAARQMDRWATA